MQQSVRSYFLKFKFDRLNCFCTGARQTSVHHQETFPWRNFSNHENCKIKFPLNTFTDQITIFQISFEVFDVKQINTRAK